MGEGRWERREWVRKAKPKFDVGERAREGGDRLVESKAKREVSERVRERGRGQRVVEICAKREV